LAGGRDTTGAVVSTGTAAAATPLCEKVLARSINGIAIYVPAAANGSQTCHISRSQAANTTIVRHLQRTMIKCYGALHLVSPYQDEKIVNLTADGDFGPRTEAALKAVRRNIYVTVDGSYGPITRDAMRFIKTDGSTCYDYR
jgi:peptidoglycan hydrolase-like protein with peptidoglycan-binding domain